MIREKLIDYIKKLVKKGYNEYDIIELLKKYHYSYEDIKETVDYIHEIEAKKKQKTIFTIITVIIIFTGILIVTGQNKNYIVATDNDIKSLAPKDEINVINSPIIFEETDKPKFGLFCNKCQYESGGECIDYACCEDKDCEDGNPGIKNVCKGTPKMCYDIVVIPCDDGNPACKKNGIFGMFSSSKNNKNKKNIPIVSNESVEIIPVPLPECTQNSDCNVNEQCHNNECHLLSCLDMAGKNCDNDQTCEGSLLESNDNPRCCVGFCKSGELDCVADYGETPDEGCDGGCSECLCTENSTNAIYSYNYNNWETHTCVYMGSFDENLWIGSLPNNCNDGVVSEWQCLCGNDYCGYSVNDDVWDLCSENSCQQQ